MRDVERLMSKFLGGMIGCAVGDAIGELAFRYPTREMLRSEIARRDKLIYTDDTAMAIGLAESISQVEGLDPQHVGDTFCDNFEREPWRGYAAGPPTVFSLVKRRGFPYAKAARTLYGGEGSFGNGAAMRVVPVGLFYHDTLDIYERAQQSASVTHAHPIGVDGAAVQARAVARAVTLDPEEPFPGEGFLQDLIDFARTPEMLGKIARVRALIAEGISPSEAIRHLGCSVAVHESLPFALYAFVCHPKSFEDCLFCATLNGGDRDTLGAMACAVSGAYLGVEAIPSTWRIKVENRAYIERLARKLVEGAVLLA